MTLKADNNNGWGRRRIKFLNPRIMLLSKCKFNTEFYEAARPYT